jgi:hypothetical protein
VIRRGQFASAVLLSGLFIDAGCPAIPDPLPGQRWENTATGAYGFIGFAKIFITKNGQPVSEGQCYCDNQTALLISVRDGLTPPTEQSDALVEAVRGRAVFWCRAAADDLGIDPGTDNCEDAVEADGFPHQAGSCRYWLPIGGDGGCPPIEPDATMGDTMSEPDMMDSDTGDETATEPVGPPSSLGMPSIAADG